METNPNTTDITITTARGTALVWKDEDGTWVATIDPRLAQTRISPNVPTRTEAVAFALEVLS